MSKIHGGNIFQFAHEQRIEPYEVIDFSANINPLGPNGLILALKSITSYGSIRCSWAN